MDIGMLIFGGLAIIGIVAIMSMSIALGRDVHMRGGPTGFQVSSRDSDESRSPPDPD